MFNVVKNIEFRWNIGCVKIVEICFEIYGFIEGDKIILIVFIKSVMDFCMEGYIFLLVELCGKMLLFY